ncbi:signal peptidase II [Kineococcus rubinsiae]|uniref:signal peptidase II n=1 Tax=Kineococcus rubinsiae TaxID=2609562 RepID=UPI0027E4A9C1|nr:signal peptidase II [Kineococcus rubinsiae]
MRRAALYIGAAAVLAVAWGVRTWAERDLTGDGRDVGLLQLRLTYNPGAAFSLGAEHPTLVLIITSVLCLAIAIAGWWAAAHRPGLQLAGMASILGGALANLTDRLGDGVVTDYFHSGWWPTFNLPDVTIVIGALLLMLAEIRRPADSRQTPAATTAPATDPGSPSGA